MEYVVSVDALAKSRDDSVAGRVDRSRSIASD
jgi:hypothetical protein